MGLTCTKFWSRKNFKGAETLYCSTNATLIPLEEKESYRWIEGIRATNKALSSPNRLVHIGDREADIFEFFNEAIKGESNFLIRIKADRKTVKEKVNISDVMNDANVRGKHVINIRDLKMKLEIKFEKMTIQHSTGIKREKLPRTHLKN